MRLFRSLLFLPLFLTTQLFADCTSPQGVAGELEFISTDYKYCDGTNWKSLIGVTGAGCSELGKMILAGGILSYCNGTNYISMIGTGTDGACSVTGKFEYDSANARMEVCDGTNWRYFPTGGGGNPPPTFTAHTFTPCGSVGALGPNLAACQASYASSSILNDFTINTQGIQEWTVPETGDYLLVAAGAAGTGDNGAVGRGALVGGVFSLTQGTVLKIAVGQLGNWSSPYGGTGGGGTFVWTSRPGTPLLVAGGGGGQGRSGIGQDASFTTSGTTNVNCAAAGTSGNGGSAGTGLYPGAAGAGWISNGANSSSNLIPGGISSSLIGGNSANTNVNPGGFGGGGAGYRYYGGGGGGGYSGGGSGTSYSYGGCGGGSYNSSSNPIGNSFNSAEGYLAVYPYDSSSDCLPIEGSTCTSGGIFAGEFMGAKLMVTPSGCTNSSTPTCAGGNDTITLRWRGSSGTNADIPGLTNINSSSEPSSYSERGEIATPIITAHSSISADSAADYCADMVYGGYDDWYLPSKSELLKLYCMSNGSIGFSGYPEEEPNCAAFGGKKSILSGFTSGSYWSSSERSSSNAWAHQFSGGSQRDYSKASSYYVRCVRRFDSSPAPVAPTGLSLTHTTRSKNLTVSWTGSGSNASDCVVQSFNGTKWVNAGNVNCNATATNVAASLQGVGNNWNGRQVRLAAYGGYYPLATFSQTLNCSSVSATTTSTPTIDEDCNGVWDETYYPYYNENNTTLNFYAAYSCPASHTQYDSFIGGNINFNFNQVSFNISAGSVYGVEYSDSGCTTVYNASSMAYGTGYSSSNSGSVPTVDDDGYNWANTGCQPHPIWGFAGRYFTRSSAITAWHSSTCYYNYSGPTYYK